VSEINLEGWRPPQALPHGPSLLNACRPPRGPRTAWPFYRMTRSSAAPTTTWCQCGSVSRARRIFRRCTSALKRSTSSEPLKPFPRVPRCPPAALQRPGSTRLSAFTVMTRRRGRRVRPPADISACVALRASLCSQVDLVRSLSGHIGGVISLSQTPDGLLVSGGWEGHARVWDIATGSSKFVLEGHENGV